MQASRIVAAGVGVLCSAGILALYTGQLQADPKSALKTPRYVVDPTWPKPYPTALHPVSGREVPWITGEVAGTCIDSRDHVFIVTRGNIAGLAGPEDAKGVAAPPVIEFDTEGNVVNAWGDRNVLPNGIHGCFVDYQDNVWIAGNGDGIVQKYTHDGSLLLTIGTRGVCDNPPANTCGNSGANPAANASHTLLNQPADMFVDPKPDPVTGERGSVYIADGYGNHRVAVFDRNGQYLRQWGGVAGTVNDPVADFPDKFGAGDGGHPHCVLLGTDDLVYVCDRQNDRIQVFTRTGALVRVIPVVPGTGQTQGPYGALNIIGSAWDLDFSNDKFQTFLFEVDGGNEQMHIMSRTSGAILASFGGPGHEAGKFTFLHSVAKDSKGNLYTGETINGRRVQKFKHVECNSGQGVGQGQGNCE